MRTAKKITFLLLAIGLMLSCSKDGDGGLAFTDPNKEIKVSMGNIVGNWYISKVVRPDGTVVNYQGNCTSRDYVEITWEAQSRIISHTYRSSESGCVHEYNLYGCQGFILLTDNNENEITTCNSSYNGVITSLTSNTMHLELNEANSYVFGALNPAKALIFSRS